MTQKESFKAQDDFISFLSNEVLADCDFNSLTDTSYVTDILRKMTKGFCRIYNSDEITYDMDYVLVPAVIKPENESRLYAGIVQLDVTSSGEHYGTDFLTEFGVIGQSNERPLAVHRKFLRSVIPYEYYPTVPYPGDIHVDWSKCPSEVMEIIHECNSQTQAGGMNL